MTIILLLLTFIYFLIIVYFAFGVIFIKEGNNCKKNFISVIVAARNEEKYLPKLLNNLSKQKYENFEVIIANDRSTDSTEEILQNFCSLYPERFQYINIKNESENFVGKKHALNEAIKLSFGEILAFTDADCLPSPSWLDEINKMFDDDVDIVAGYSPLVSPTKNLLMNQIKNLERSSVFAITAGSFFWHWGITCTARNFSYRKSLFIKCDGFETISHILSGDDDLMLQKISLKSRKMKFMFSEKSFVPSYDKDDLKSQISLETRRGSKWKYYTLSIKILSFLVMLYYLMLTFILFYNFIESNKLGLLFTSFLIKCIGEFILLFAFLSRIKKLKLFYVFPIAEVLYIPYFIFFGIKGTFGKYKWKN
jgi:glycosyltransferase involved in cell wall biosynthesis